jgi:hypothetical protein
MPNFFCYPDKGVANLAGGSARTSKLREIKALKTPADQGGGAVVCSGAACAGAPRPAMAAA